FSALGTASTASRYSANVDQFHSIPASSTEAGMSSARSRLPSTSLCSPYRDGARLNPQFPITTVVTPCQAEGDPWGSQKTCASICVCASRKPGVTTLPLASIVRDGERSASSLGPTATMCPSSTATSASTAGPPDPSTTTPPRISTSIFTDAYRAV